MIITELTANTRRLWDGYVTSSARGLPQHLSGWQEVQRQTYGHRPHYLMAMEGNQVVGVLPLFLIQSLWLGNTLRTMPGGLCADNDEVALALIERGRSWAQAINARRFFIADTRQAWPGDLLTTTNHVCWVLDVRLEAEALWKGLDDNIRRQVRIARDHKLRVAIDRTGQLLKTFYEIFSDFAHQSGTPLFGLHFLENVIQTFPSSFSIAVVYQEERPLGGYFQLELGHTIYGMWGGTPRQFLQLRPVYLAYWEIIQDAIKQGFHRVDMGRSPAGSNASKFKGQWGGVSQPIYQQRIVFGHDRSPYQGNEFQQGRLFKLVTYLWPKLPLSIARYVGPKLRRHVPFA
ncbi:MAG TPA: GNAT family N-acetyltransferase [Anaerolineales bacterium]|nr:GNAT family N-acetyltransferase [Anaerolineales bacterium]